MANRAAVASTNFTTATTWATIDATSFSGSEAGTLELNTSYQTSSTFTPGAITIDGIGVKLNAREGTTGTITVALDQATVDVAGTVVTINVSDLPAATNAGLGAGWIFFKFAAPKLLTAATAYGVKAKTSNAAQVVLWITAGTNLSRYLRTTTTGAPAAGDDLIITKEWTAAGTGTARTVTMDQTVATDYGSAPSAANGLVTPGISVCQGGTLSFGTSAATNYLLRLSNSLIVYSEGTLNMGTTGTPMPRDSSAILEFDLAADADYALIARPGGTVSMQGQSRTIGKNIVSAKMTADAAASGGAPSTSTLTIDTDTGWLSGDIIAVASTSRITFDCEFGTLNANAGASSIVVKNMTAAAVANAVPPTSNRGLLVAHSGTSPTQAEVILLTRNVKVRSTSATLMSYFQVMGGTVIDIDWTEFYFIGCVSNGQRGIDVEFNSTGATNFSMQFSSIHDTEYNGLACLSYDPTATVTSFVFSSNTTWNTSTIQGPALSNSSTTSNNWIIDSNISMFSGNSGLWLLNDIGGTFTNNTMVAAQDYGLAPNDNNTALGTFSGNTFHSCGGIALGSSVCTGTMTNTTIWRNSAAINLSSFLDVTFDTLTMFGNSGSDYDLLINSGSYPKVTFKNMTSNGDTAYPVGKGLTTIGSCGGLLIFDNCDFSTVSGIKTAHTTDIDFSASNGFSGQIILRNTKLGAATEVGTPTNLINSSFVASQKNDQVAGNHMTWMTNGKVQTDTTIFNTASPSMRMTPTSTTVKMESAPLFQGMKVAVTSSATVTIAVYTYKSTVGDGTAYNGNQPRLVLKNNPAIGINSDVVIATHSATAGTWQRLTGVTVAATDDGVMEFVVDCDGNTGWVNVDDWSAT